MSDNAPSRETLADMVGALAARVGELEQGFHWHSQTGLVSGGAYREVTGRVDALEHDLNHTGAALLRTDARVTALEAWRERDARLADLLVGAKTLLEAMATWRESAGETGMPMWPLRAMELAAAIRAELDAGPLYSPAADDADLAPRQRQAGARGAV